MRTSPLLVAAALLCSACEGESLTPVPASTEPSFSSQVYLSVEGDPEVSGLPEGFQAVWIELGRDVEYLSTFTMAPGGDSGDGERLNGHAFEFESGWLTIGPERYGAFADGDQVRVTAEGVFVEGRHLGPLPASVDVGFTSPFLENASGGAKSTPEPPFPANVTVTVGGSGLTELPEGYLGILVELDDDLDYLQFFAVSAGSAEMGATLNGHPFAFESGFLTIGPERYGPIEDGVLVRVTAEGVSTNGTHLGPLHAPVEEE